MRRWLRREFCVEHLAARLIELVDGAGLAEAPGELRRRRAGLARLREQCDRRARRDRAVVSAARLGGDAQRFQCGPQLRLTEAVLRDLGARRQRREIRILATIRPSISNPPLAAMRESEKVGFGGRLACAVAASDMPSSL